MNIGIKCWSDKSFNKLYKEFSVKLSTLSIYIFNFYKDKFANCVRINPKRVSKFTNSDNKQNHSFHLSNTLSNSIMKFSVTSVLAVMFIGMLGMSYSNAEKHPVNYITIQVSSGDTVWTIASRYISDKEDIRELVYAIKTINGLNNNAFLSSGQTLKVPMPNSVLKVSDSLTK